MSQISPLDFFKHVTKVTPPGDIEKVVDALLSDTHPEDHVYEDDPAFPGTCKVCHFVAEETTSTCCGKSARKHVQRALEMMAGPAVIEVFVIEI